ncbi:MAG: hypothetical protein FWC91_13555 [Defluviitaleaceae bacterium]|nr:hypothetical protein [Defluviitaleaceae bacterium]
MRKLLSWFCRKKSKELEINLLEIMLTDNQANLICEFPVVESIDSTKSVDHSKTVYILSNYMKCEVTRYYNKGLECLSLLEENNDVLKSRKSLQSVYMQYKILKERHGDKIGKKKPQKYPIRHYLNPAKRKRKEEQVKKEMFGTYGALALKIAQKLDDSINPHEKVLAELKKEMIDNFEVYSQHYSRVCKKFVRVYTFDEIVNKCDLDIDFFKEYRNYYKDILEKMEVEYFTFKEVGEKDKDGGK